MTIEILIFLILIGIVLILFTFEVLPIDVTALTFLVVLLATGYLNLEEAISGFSNKAVITIAAMFVLSQALVKTGFLEVVADRLSKIGGKGQLLSFGVFLLTVSLVSAFINNTAAVAIFIPLAIQLSQRWRKSPSKVLIPLSFAAIYGGTLTLIGTSTNLLVSSIVMDYQIDPLGMFEFTAMGLIFLAAGTAYNTWIVPRILPSRAGVSSLTRNYHLAPYLTEFKVPEDSPLIGSTCIDRSLNEKYDVTVLSVIRENKRFDTNIRNIRLRENDILLVRGTLENFVRFREEEKALLLTDVKMGQKELTGDESLIVEGLVTQRSGLIGKTIKDINFRKKYGAFVLAIRREGRTLREKIAHIVLHFADTLLIFVPKSRLTTITESPDIAVLHEHDIQLHKGRFWWLAIAIIPVIMLSAALNIFDILVAALIGMVILLVVRAITINESYSAINWSVIILIAAFIPVGIAMEKTGTTGLLGTSIASIGGQFSSNTAPYAVLSVLYLVTVLLTAIMSNTSAAIVLTPIAIVVAREFGVDPRPFIFAICYGASTCFMTPIGYQTNLMVYGPGRYRFIDFVKVGLPLNILFWILATLFIPLIWPFSGS